MHRFFSAGLLLLFVIAVPVARGTELGIRQDRFTIDGRATFLLGCSYYGALGASPRTIHSDLDELQRLGFNWIRVFADWTAYETDLSAVDGATGAPRQPYLDALVRLCDDCDRRGMVVDVTLARGAKVNGRQCLHDLPSHSQAVRTLVTALEGRKNWYLDLSNERNIRDARFTSVEELAELRGAARKLNPRLLVTASHGGDASRDEVQAYLKTAHLNFLSIHRPRDAESAANGEQATLQYRQWIREIGPVVPLQYDEPFRRGYDRWQPVAGDFAGDLESCRRAGAAGWCFHNGDTRGTPDRQPRRSFDLRTRPLFEQLDREERAFLAQLRPMTKPRAELK